MYQQPGVIPPPLVIAMLLHRGSPSRQSRLASAATLIQLGVTLWRSVDRGDAKTLPSLAVAAIMVLCVPNLVLTTLPQAKRR